MTRSNEGEHGRKGDANMLHLVFGFLEWYESDDSPPVQVGTQNRSYSRYIKANSFAMLRRTTADRRWAIAAALSCSRAT